MIRALTILKRACDLYLTLSLWPIGTRPVTIREVPPPVRSELLLVMGGWRARVQHLPDGTMTYTMTRETP